MRMSSRGERGEEAAAAAAAVVGVVTAGALHAPDDKVGEDATFTSQPGFY